MLILDATTKSLEIALAGAVTTNQLPVVASYVDVTTSTYAPGSSDTASNNTTAVTVVAAPAASTQRQVKLLTVQNKDTASATVILQLNDNSTIRQIVKVTLAVNDTLIYTDGEGFRTLDSSGQIKTSAVAGTVPDTGVLFTDNTTGNASTGAHGFLKKLDNSAAHFMDGQGNWNVPAGTGVASAFRASRSTNQSITGGAFAKVQLPTEAYDTNNDFDNVTNYRWTPPAGIVHMDASALLDSAGTEALIRIYKNGSAIAGVNGGTNFSGETAMAVSCDDSANGTDYYELFVYIQATHNVEQASFNGNCNRL